MHYLIQNESTVETRACIAAVLITDDNSCSRIDISEIPEQEKNCVPVGSVEFVKEYLKHCNIPQPNITCYPEPIQGLLKRKVNLLMSKLELFDTIPLGQEVFIKPYNVKEFTGFKIKRVSVIMGDCHSTSKFDEFFFRESFEHNTDPDNLRVFFSSPDDSKIWVSEVVDFAAEWRYYIQDYEIVGFARYDNSPIEEIPEPDISIVEDAILKLSVDHPYVLDFGVLNGSYETALVEYNDAWAIGLYGSCMYPSKYLEFLRRRFEFFFNTI